VAEVEGLDAEMPVADFLALPQALTDAWQNVVYELNPHWYPFTPSPLPEGEGTEGEPEAEKKGGSGNSDSG